MFPLAPSTSRQAQGCRPWNAHTHTHTHTQAYSNTHTFTHKHTQAHTHTGTHTHTRTGTQHKAHKRALDVCPAPPSWAWQQRGCPQASQRWRCVLHLGHWRPGPGQLPWARAACTPAQTTGQEDLALYGRVDRMTGDGWAARPGMNGERVKWSDGQRHRSRQDRPFTLMP